jgi:hypothetical protein
LNLCKAFYSYLSGKVDVTVQILNMAIGS